MFSITDKDGTIFSSDSVEKTIELYRAFHSERNDDNGWITWYGGECPVDSDSQVIVRLRNGRIEADLGPDVLYWYNTGAFNDIVAYKVVK